jgi:cytochrome c oxidase subunit 3
MKPPHPDHLPDDSGGEGELDPASNSNYDEILQMGVRLFLASLTMLFAASIVGYMVMRSRLHVRLELPVLLWASTGVLALCAVAVAGLQRAAGRGAWASARRWVWAIVGVSSLFLVVQTPAVLQLLEDHEATNGPSLYGITFVLIVLHALHVVGGLVPLIYLGRLAATGRLGPQRLPAVRGCCLYWHFLEAVWALMFGVFLLAQWW